MASPDAVVQVLHIENDILIGAAMYRLLKRKLNADVYQVVSTEQIREQLAYQKWDVVISDWQLRDGLNGGDIYHLVVAICPELKNKYIFNSSHWRASLFATLVNAYFIEKPASSEQIVEAVKKVLDRETVVQ